MTNNREIWTVSLSLIIRRIER